MGKEQEVLKVSKVFGRKIIWITWQPIGGNTVYNVYVIIPNSRYLKLEVFGTDVTYREDDEIGVDTAHRRIEDKGDVEKIRYCVNAIKRIIEKCERVLI